MSFASVSQLVEAIADGRMVLLVDDRNRENEGDLVLAAAAADAASIGFMAREGRGLICVPMAAAVADRLGLGPMVPEDPDDDDPSRCAFTISVDARSGITTGISAFDRAHTARLLADPGTRADELRRPGHLFPLRARAGGVLERPGHTEAAVDLARLAGRAPVGVICEVMKDDGTMARLPDLAALAAREGLLLGKIEDLIAYRRDHDPSPAAGAGSRDSLRHLSRAQLPTPYGVFTLHVFANCRDEEIVALCLGEVVERSDRGFGPLTRVHSACFTGDVLGSLRCDCGGQLDLALRTIGEEERGIVVYLPQEGRGIGLARKIEAYRLQEEEGLDTVDANLRLGLPADARTYEDAAAVLDWFGVDRLRLLTNNPAKLEGLERYGIQVTRRLPIEPGPGPVNLDYLRAKKGRFGHLFEAV